MPKFQAGVTLNPNVPNETFRVSDGAAGVTASFLTRVDAGKLVKLVGDSQMGLCAAGDEIQGFLSAGDDIANSDGFSMGAVQRQGRFRATLDGLQATPGTGTVVVGDFVVTGTVVARGTTLGSGAPRVCKATAAATALIFKWRVIAITSGAGAPGSVAVIESVL